MRAQSATYGGGGEVHAKRAAIVAWGQRSAKIVPGAAPYVENAPWALRGDDGLNGGLKRLIPACGEKEIPGVEHHRAVADKFTRSGEQVDETPLVDVE
jgi:hypothetical protein